MATREDVERARRLLHRHHARLTPDERRTLEALLKRIEAGTISRQEALRMLAGPLRGRGLTVDEALRRLRRSPYYGLVSRLLPER